MTADGVRPSRMHVADRWLLAALDDLPMSSLLIFDRDLRFVVARGSALGRNGYESSAFEGRLCADAFPPQRWAVYRDAYVGALDGRSTELTVRSPDEEATYSVRISPIVDDGGTVLGGVSIAVDITAVTQAEERYRLLAENSSDVVYQISGGGIIEWMSPSVEQVLGWRPEDVIGTPSLLRVHPDDRDDLLSKRAELLVGQDTVSLTARYLTAEGGSRWMVSNGRAIRDARGELVIVGGLHDVDDLVRAQDLLADSERTFRTAIESAPIGMTLTRPDGVITVANQSLCDMLQRDPEWLVGRRIDEQADPEDRMRLAELQERILESGGSVEAQIRLLRADGHPVWTRCVSSLLSDEAGHPERFLIQFVDITREHEAVEDLQRRAFHDDLTGLRNRAWVLDMLEVDLRGARRSGLRVGFLMIDLDDFKTVNDSLGHAAGDELLSIVGERLLDITRPLDRVARMGGDEFVVVIPDVSDPQRLEALADRVIATISQEISVMGHRVAVGASVGISVSTPTSTVQGLVQEADAALFRAKFSGRGRWRFADTRFDEQALARVSAEDEIRNALIRHEFVVHYQPVVRLSDRQLVAYEAFVRWVHPTRGLLLPEEFLPIAEASGLIVRIGNQVLEEVCSLLASGAVDVPIDVNMASAQLSEPDWASTFREILDRYGVDPGWIAFEITETSALSLTDESRAQVRYLSDLGLGLFVDDFGTGFSSVTALRDLPVRGLKLDESFVRDLGRARSPALGTSAGLAGLARGLGLIGVAEGVEDDQQLRILMDHGWTHGQGRLFGAPAAWQSTGEQR